MYSWAVNNIKLDRAIKLSSSKEEADIQAIYISLGGKVDGPIIKSAPVTPVPNDENNQVAPKAPKEPKVK